MTVLTGQIMNRTGFDNLILIYLLGIAIGGAVGLLNGMMVARLGLPPIIATLGMASVIDGFLRYYTNGAWINRKRRNPDHRFRTAQVLFGAKRQRLGDRGAGAVSPCSRWRCWRPGC